MFNSMATASWIPAIEQLHFIRPWVWLLLIPAVVLFGFHLTKGEHKQGWAQLIDKHLLQWLMPQGVKKSSALTPWVLLIFWVLALAALSGPSWKQLPQPLFSSKAARVLVLDLSMSMDATDVAPSRLERAQFKIRDLLQKTNDGQTGLIVYAGDAFVLSPLTTDGDTIENLLMALSTDLMPLMGSNPETGIAKAIELLDNAQVPTGTIIWVTDGAEQRRLDQVSELISDSRYKLSMLAIGTEQGSPIKLQGGAGFLKDNRGEIVVPKLHYNRLAEFATSVNAKLTPLSTDDADIDLMLEQKSFSLEQQMEEQDMFADSWEDSGYWLILVLLPIVLYAFKQPKVLGMLVLVFTASLLPNSVYAQTQNPVPPVETSSDFSLDTITDYFLNDDQKGKKQLDAGDAEGAFDTFKDPNWKAVSAYRQGKFDDAQYNFQAQENGLSAAEALYNKGNAQVMNGEYGQAIESYQQALEEQSDFSDAQHNLGVAHQLKEQKEKKEQEEQEQDEEQDSENQENSESEEETEQQPEQAPQQESEQESEQKQQQELDEQFKEEEKDQELEQWLRRISDDPGGLLRRKMYLEYRKRGVNHKVDQTW